MGVSTNERKRNHHSYSSPPSQIPSLASLRPDSCSSKRSKLLASSNQAHHSSMAEDRVFKASRFRQYPDTKSPIRREPQAPVRPPKLGGFQNSKSSGLKSVHSDSVVKFKNVIWNGLKEHLGHARQAAFNTLRHFTIRDGVVVNKDDAVVNIDDDEVVEVVEIDDDEVVEVVEIKDDEVVNLEGECRGDSSIEKVVDGQFKALSLPVQRDVCIDNMMVVSTEKMFKSLSMTDKKDDLGLIEYKKKVCDVDRKSKMLDSPKNKQLALQLFESSSLTERKDDLEVYDVDKMLDSPEKKQLALQLIESLSLTEKRDNLGLIKYKKKVCDVDKMLDSPEKKQLALELFESLSLTEKKDDLGLIEYKKMVCDLDRDYKMLDYPESQIVVYEKKQLALQLFRPLRIVEAEEEDAKKEMIDLAFKHLTKDEEDQVTSALSSYPRWKLLVKHESSNIDITVDRLQCLRPKQWLNDEVINLYFELLKERENRDPDKFLKCHFFNTFFYKKLISGNDGYDFQSVRRWTSQGKLGYCIFDCDKIFVPIHKEIHWCLAVINIEEEKFQYLDSLGHEDSRVLEILARYFADEVKDKSGKEIDVSLWEQEFIADLPQGPEQENGFDCGVFMIKYADFYSRGIGLCFDQEDMPYFRQRTAKEILNLKAE